MDERQFKQRTKLLALRVIRLVESLPPGQISHVLGKQLLRSATSVGANYRSACRARSTADLIAKLSIVEEEADECLYWLELLIESNLIAEAKVKSLMSETDEILSMIVASIKTLRAKANLSSIQNPKSKIETFPPFLQRISRTSWRLIVFGIQHCRVDRLREKK